MTKILILTEDKNLPTANETYNAMSRFAMKYGVEVCKTVSGNFKVSDIFTFDILYCIRCQSPLSYGIIKLASQYGKKIFFLLDDDLKDMPQGSFWYPERKKWLLKCLSGCDALISSNQLITDEYKEYLPTMRTVIMNTSVDPESIVRLKTDKSVIKIVMAASEWHTAEFDQMIKPVVPELFEEYNSKISLWFVGLHPEFNKNAEYYQLIHYVPAMTLHEYSEYMSTHHFDIGLGIIIPDHFSERKYFNKFIEYTRYGICGIYSDCMPYRLAVKDGENGYMVKNSPQAWHDKIKQVIDSPCERESILDNAQKYVKEKHCDSYIFEKLSNDIPEFISFTSPEVKQIKGEIFKKYKLRQIMFRTTEMSYLTFLSIKLYGIKDAIRRIKRKLCGSV